MYKGIFVDDDVRDFKYAESMSHHEAPGLTVKGLLPDKTLVELSDQIRGDSPDLLALDFRLDEQLCDDHSNRYKAAPLAQHLRDHATESPRDDFPIILVSHEDKVRDFYNPDLTAHDLFDVAYEKENLGNSTTKKEIFSLVIGYKRIIELLGNKNLLLNCLRLDTEFEDAVNSQLVDDVSSLRAPHQISRYVLKNIINRAGPLIDQYELLARLGIDPSSDDIEKVKEILRQQEINYSGIFAEGWERWWTFKLEDFGRSLCGQSFGELNADERCACLSEHFGLKIRPVRSRWTNKSDVYFAFACASCKLPTEFDFSVEAHDPLLFDFMDKKRICWKCIQLGEHVENKIKVASADLFISKKIENGEIVFEEGD
jgi:hypothetical protein